MDRRIERLEASVRKWKMISTAGVVCVLVAALLGADPGPLRTHELVRVRLLQVVDQDGKVVMSLSSLRFPGNTTAFGYFETKTSTGAPLLQFSASGQAPEGGLVTLYNRQAQAAVVMSSTDALRGDVTVYNAQGANRSLSVNPDEKPPK